MRSTRRPILPGAGRNSDWIERHDIEKIFSHGSEAFVTYRCVAKDGKSFRNTEFFAFEGNKVKRIDVYFGAAYQQWRVRRTAAIKGTGLSA